EGSTLRDPWWHPYDETLGKALRQTAAVLYGRPSIRAGALRAGAAPLLKLGGRGAPARCPPPPSTLTQRCLSGSRALAAQPSPARSSTALDSGPGSRPWVGLVDPAVDELDG